MRNDHFAKFLDARQALIDAETAHPDSPQLAALHTKLWDLVGGWSQLFSEDQVTALGGGTDK